MLAEMLKLPTWARDLSPLYQLGLVPVERWDGTAARWLAAGPTVGLLVAFARYRARDLAA